MPKSIIKINDEHISLNDEKAIVSMILAYKSMSECGMVPFNSDNERAFAIVSVELLLEKFESMDGWDEVNSPTPFEIDFDPETNLPIRCREIKKDV